MMSMLLKNKNQIPGYFLFILSIIILLNSPLAQAQTQVQTDGKVSCGYDEKKGKWLPGKMKKNGKFQTLTQTARKLRKKAKKLKNNKRKQEKLLKKAKALLKKSKKQTKAVCKKFNAGEGASSGVVSSLRQIPDVSALVSSPSSTRATTRAASGTPPTLAEIGTGDVSTIFWRDGVISRLVAGNPTAQDCTEFFGGSTDGTSGGLGACFMAQGVGRAMEQVLSASTSTCYMKNFPNQTNLQTGGVEVSRGRLPGGDIESLFSSPTGAEDRLVRVNITGMSRGGPNPEEPITEEMTFTIFINVSNQQTLATDNLQFAAQLYFCSPNGEVEGFERITVDQEGLFKSVNQGTDYGRFTSVVEAHLSQDSDGSFSFADEKDRSASVVFEEAELTGFNFKSEVMVTQDGQLKVKSYDEGQNSSRKGYSVANFLGTSIPSLQFTEGAYNGQRINQTETNDTRMSTEYRDTLYVSAPSSELANTTAEVSLDTDPFFGSPPAAQLESVSFSCTAATPDVVVNLDMSKSSVQQSVAECETNRLENMDFCWSESILAAERAWLQSCTTP